MHVSIITIFHCALLYCVLFRKRRDQLKATFSSFKMEVKNSASTVIKKVEQGRTNLAVRFVIYIQCIMELSVMLLNSILNSLLLYFFEIACFPKASKKLAK